MPEDDGWDWPVLLYIGTVMLRMSEAKFWRTTPRKLNALVRAHIKMNPSGDNQGSSPKKGQASQGYIDQII